MSEGRKGRCGWSWWYLLLLVQFVAVLCPPFYNRAEPACIAMPFFCGYQLLWVIVGAVLTAVVYVRHIALQLVGRPDRRQGYSRSLIFKC
jgi:Protein of unknown function (DUF3311)